MSPSIEVLQLLMEQIDAWHKEAHMRLRRDVTEGFIAVNNDIEALTKAQREAEVAIAKQQGTRERRRELSGYKAIVIAAAIGGGFRLIEVLVTQIFSLLQGHHQ